MPAAPVQLTRWREDPVLVACGHGTRSAAGRAAITGLVDAIAALRPGLEVAAAALDVHGPTLAEVVADRVAAGRAVVVVPLLLSRGYHLHTDIGAVVRAGAGRVRAARALGPDPRLAEVLAERVRGCGCDDPAATVVLAAAGSADPGARADVARAAGDLAGLRAGPVLPAYLSAARPALADVVGAQVAAGREVTVASYLLAPGVLADRVAATAVAAGASRVSAPLAPHPILSELALSRYAAVAG